MVSMVFLLIALAPLTSPTPTTAPTIAEEVETGIPNMEKRCIPKADEIFIIDGLEVRIIEATSRSIDQVNIRLIGKEPAGTAGE